MSNPNFQGSWFLSICKFGVTQESQLALYFPDLNLENINAMRKFKEIQGKEEKVKKNRKKRFVDKEIAI